MPRCEDHSTSAYVSAVVADKNSEENSPAKKYAEKRRDRWSQDLRLSLGGKVANGESVKEVADAAEKELQRQLVEQAQNTGTVGISNREARETAKAVIGDFRKNPKQYRAEHESRAAKASPNSFMQTGEDFSAAPKLSSIRVPVQEVDESKTSLAARREFASTTEDSEAIDRGIKSEPAGSVLENLAKNPNITAPQLQALWLRVHSEKSLEQQEGRLTTAIRSNPAWNKDSENRAVVEVENVRERRSFQVAKRLAGGGAKAARQVLRTAVEEARNADDFNVINDLSRQGKRTVSLAVLGNKAVTAPIVQRLAKDPDTQVKSAARKHRLFDEVSFLAEQREAAREKKAEQRARKKAEAESREAG